MISRFAVAIFVSCGLSIATAFAAQSSAGFIDPPPPEVKPVKEVPGVSTWEKTGINRADYSKVAIDPVTIFLSPTSEYKGIEPDQMKALADGMRAEVVKALEPKYPVVDKLDKGVLRIRIAVTNVSVKKKSRGLLTFTPIGMVVHAATDSVAKNFIVVNAGVEAELIDGATGERLLVMIDSDPMKRAGGAKPQDETWVALQARLKEAATRLRQRMDEAHAKP